MLGFFARLALAVLVAGSAAACQGDAATVLHVGDCINHQNATDANGDPIENTVVVDCAQPHADEVFYTFSYPNAPVAFPGYEAIGATQQQECQAAFMPYVGLAWDESYYTINYSGPTERSWASGDTRIVCLLEDASGETLTGSARGTAR